MLSEVQNEMWLARSQGLLIKILKRIFGLPIYISNVWIAMNRGGVVSMFDFNFLNTDANDKCEKAFNKLQELYLMISSVFSDIRSERKYWTRQAMSDWMNLVMESTFYFLTTIRCNSFRGVEGVGDESEMISTKRKWTNELLKKKNVCLIPLTDCYVFSKMFTCNQ